jgi:hypothetical protein
MTEITPEDSLCSILHNHHSPTKNSINVAKLENLCRGEVLGYVIQVNMMHQSITQEKERRVHFLVMTVLAEF